MDMVDRPLHFFSLNCPFYLLAIFWHFIKAPPPSALKCVTNVENLC
jgi:hypothetical protein